MSPSTRKGLGLMSCLMVGWLVSLVCLLSLDLQRLPWWLLCVAVLVRTQLQTGLFIVGHDAMHRLLWPGQRRWNDALGAMALGLYAGLPYGRCCANHRRHHRNPGTVEDPDFPRDLRSGALFWYLQFMGGYLTLPQMGRLLSAWLVLVLATSGQTPTALLNMVLLGLLPLLLSSLQLFVFGTYLPHRAQRVPICRTHPDSLALPPWLSFLACFHFGYHREHHDHPSLSWFELPAARLRALRLARG